MSLTHKMFNFTARILREDASVFPRRDGRKKDAKSSNGDQDTPLVSAYILLFKLESTRAARLIVRSRTRCRLRQPDERERTRVRTHTSMMQP